MKKNKHSTEMLIPYPLTHAPLSLVAHQTPVHLALPCFHPGAEPLPVVPASKVQGAVQVEVIPLQLGYAQDLVLAVRGQLLSLLREALDGLSLGVGVLERGK